MLRPELDLSLKVKRETGNGNAEEGNGKFADNSNKWLTAVRQ